MSKNLEVEGDIVGNGEEDQGVEESCNKEDGGCPSLREASSCWDFINSLVATYMEQPGRKDR